MAGKVTDDDPDLAFTLGESRYMILILRIIELVKRFGNVLLFVDAMIAVYDRIKDRFKKKEK